MADDVTLPLTGSGDATAKVASDEHVTKGHLQLMKLAHSADGDATHVTADADGLEVQINKALPAGTNAIGKLAANDGVDIGDVDVASVPAPLSTTGGGTEAAAQRVTLANDSTGVLSVDDGGGALTVDNAGTFMTQVDGATSVVDTGNSTTTPLGVSGVFTGASMDLLNYTAVVINIATDVASATDGMTFQFSSDGTNWDDVYTFTFAATDVARRFQFSVTSRFFRVVFTNGGTGQAHFRLQTILHIGNQLMSVHRIGDDMSPDRSAQLVKAVLAAQAAGSGDFIPVDATAAGNLKVSVEEVNGAIMPVQGDVAHDAVDSGEPVKVGAKAIAHGTNPTAVAAADRTDTYANRAGIPFTIGGHPNSISHRVNYTAAQTDTAIITVAGGLKIVVTQVMIVADNANSVDVQARVGFAAATTPTAAGVVATHPGIPAGGGFSRGDGSGILGVGADGEDLRITSEVPTGGSIDVLVTYFTIES